MTYYRKPLSLVSKIQESNTSPLQFATLEITITFCTRHQWVIVWKLSISKFLKIILRWIPLNRNRPLFLKFNTKDKIWKKDDINVCGKKTGLYIWFWSRPHGNFRFLMKLIFEISLSANNLSIQFGDLYFANFVFFVLIISWTFLSAPRASGSICFNWFSGATTNKASESFLERQVCIN